MSKACAISGCDKPGLRRALCTTHYSQVRVAGGFRTNGNIPKQPWDALVVNASMTLRLEAAHARLKQAALILDNLDLAFPRTLDDVVDSAGKEILAALDALTTKREPVVVRDRKRRVAVPILKVSPAPVRAEWVWSYAYRKAERRETVALLALGYTNEEIAKQVYRSVDCIKSRLRKAYSDTGTNNAAALVSHAWQAKALPYAITEVQDRITLPLLRHKPSDYIPSNRESQVLELLAQGKSRNDIADALGIQPLTVKSHMGSMLLKCQVSNAASLVNHAWMKGWIIND